MCTEQATHKGTAVIKFIFDYEAEPHNGDY